MRSSPGPRCAAYVRTSRRLSRRADSPLEEISHPLLVKANERFADGRSPHERIAAIGTLSSLLSGRTYAWRPDGSAFLGARGSMTTVRYGAASRPRSSGSAVCTTPPPASTATATG
jgi:hypothetical protein